MAGVEMKRRRRANAPNPNFDSGVGISTKTRFRSVYCFLRAENDRTIDIDANEQWIFGLFVFYLSSSENFQGGALFQWAMVRT